MPLPVILHVGGYDSINDRGAHFFLVPRAQLPEYVRVAAAACRHRKRSVENTRSGVAVGAGSVSLCWWLNTQNVSFEFWEAGPRELPGIVVVLGGPGRLSAPPEDRDFAMSNTFHAGAARAAASCLVLGSWVGVRQQLRHS